MRPRLAYLHLPKAAGTSIRAAFSAYYDPSVTVPWSFDRHLFGDDPRLDEVREPVFLGDAEDLRSYRYMEGHWTLPSIVAAFDPSDIVCVLREPRARFLSHYTFWRGWPDSMHDLWEPYRAARFAQLRLSEYCSEPAVAHQADNLVTRLLLGPHPLVPNDAHIRSGDIDTLAAEACDRLDGLGHADVLERGDAVYRDLEIWFGSPLIRERLNETDLAYGEPVDLDDLAATGTLALVHDRNAADLQIWHHVAQRRGMSGAEARRVSDASFAAAVAKVAIAHAKPLVREPGARHPLDRAADEQHDAVASRPSAAVRIAQLVRRGPRAVWDRIVAEVEHRRTGSASEA